MSNGVRSSEPVPADVRPSPMAPAGQGPPPPADGKRLGFWELLDRFAFSGWFIFWFGRRLRLGHKLTGSSWRELRRRLNLLPYMVCGLVAAGGVWLSLHFDDPAVLKVTMIVVMGPIVSWVMS